MNGDIPEYLEPIIRERKVRIEKAMELYGKNLLSIFGDRFKEAQLDPNVPADKLNGLLADDLTPEVLAEITGLISELQNGGLDTRSKYAKEKLRIHVDRLLEQKDLKQRGVNLENGHLIANESFGEFGPFIDLVPNDHSGLSGRSVAGENNFFVQLGYQVKNKYGRRAPNAYALLALKPIVEAGLPLIPAEREQLIQALVKNGEVEWGNF